MALLLTLLGFTLVLSLTVKRVGLETYVTLFAFTSIASLSFMYLYFRLFF